MGIDTEEQDDEISLIDLFAVLLRYKVMIIVITAVAMIGVVGFSILSLTLPPDKSPLPNQYSPAALMLINNDSSGSGGLASMISSSGLGGLAGLAGISVSRGSSYASLAVYLLGTNSLLDAVAEEFDIVQRFKIEKFPLSSSRKILKQKIAGQIDEESGVYSITCTDTDPAFARDVVNFCVDYLDRRFNDLGLDKNKLEKENLEKNIENAYREIERLEKEAQNLEYSIQQGFMGGPVSLQLNRIQLELNAQRQIYGQLKVQYEILKVSMASEKPVFQILEYAEVPEQKSKPSRGMLCIIVTFAAAFFSIFLAFLLNAINNIRRDPAAMAKLRNKEPPGKGGRPGALPPEKSPPARQGEIPFQTIPGEDSSSGDADQSRVIKL